MEDRQLSVEGFANFGGELLRVERLRQKKHPRFATLSGGKGFFEITGDKNDFDVGMNGAECIGETAAAGLRHYQIGEEEIDATSAIFGKQPTRIATAGSFNHVITETAQHADGNVTNADVVLE